MQKEPRHIGARNRALGGYIKLVLILFIGAFLAGCASATRQADGAASASASAKQVESADPAFDDFAEFSEATVPEVSDPLQGYNRFMFAFNDKFYIWAARPVSNGYAYVVPERARICVKSCFKNLLFPIRFVNNILQFKLKGSCVEVVRFGVNSTVGLAGLFDPASHFLHLEASDEDFGQTLATYGVGDGPPLVIPILGPSNLRDAVALVPDYFLDPINYVRPPVAALGTHLGERVNFLSLYSKEYDEYMRTAVDPYIFFRNAYKQNRDKKIEK